MSSNLFHDMKRDHEPFHGHVLSPGHLSRCYGLLRPGALYGNVADMVEIRDPQSSMQMRVLLFVFIPSSVDNTVSLVVLQPRAPLTLQAPPPTDHSASPHTQ